MKGFVQEKSGKYYLVLDLYDERGRRKPKWISTGLPVRGNKRKAEAKLDEVLARYEETGELPTGRSHAYQITPPGCKPREQNVLTKADMPFLDYLRMAAAAPLRHSAGHLHQLQQHSPRACPRLFQAAERDLGRGDAADAG